MNRWLGGCRIALTRSLTRPTQFACLLDINNHIHVHVHVHEQTQKIKLPILKGKGRLALRNGSWLSFGVSFGLVSLVRWLIG